MPRATAKKPAKKSAKRQATTGASRATSVPRVSLREQQSRVLAASRRRADLRARYDAAQTTDDNRRHWANADALGPDAALDPQVRRVLRNRARYEVANNSYAAGMVKTLASDCIGTGPGLQITDLRLKKESAALVEARWWGWALAVRLAQKLRTMKQAKTTDGEGFAIKFTNPRSRDRVQLDLRPIEADLVAQPAMNFEDQSRADGIIFDDFGNVAGYTVLRNHPGETDGFGTGIEFDTFPARQVIHLYNADRPGQSRGCPEIAPALPLFAQLRRYTLAVIAAAETAADFAGVVRSSSGPQDPDEVEPLDLIELEQRMLLTLPRGWDISQIKAEQPATTYEMFKRAILSEAARCITMPYNVAAGDSSSFNYSSARLDNRGYAKGTRVERSAIGAVALDEGLFPDWWREAQLIEGYLPEDAAALETPPDHDWRWDGEEHIDPLKESKAQETRLASSATNLALEYGAQGLDWEQQLRQRAREIELMRELGMPIPGEKSPADQAAQKIADQQLADSEEVSRDG